MIEKWAYRYIAKLSKSSSNDTDTLHLLTKEELAQISKVVRITYLWAGIYGVLGVLLLYVPQYYFPDYFYEYPIQFSFYNDLIYFPVTQLFYGIGLAYIEIYALMAINMKAVFKIASICGFPDKNDPDYDRHLESLMRVGLEKEDNKTNTYGLNPMEGASKWTLLLFLILLRLKATISNFIAKVILRRILGRYALRTIIDMVGVPVFAFWNAFASSIVIRETKVRIMAPNLIRQHCKDLQKRYSNIPEFKAMLYDTLQFIAVSKRRYHHNHFLLAKNVLLSFDVSVKDAHELQNGYLEQVKNLDPFIKEGIEKLLVMGLIIDGSLSPKEKTMISKLYKDGIIPYDRKKIDFWIKSFVSGRGLEGLVNMEK